jgi:hypothetical protein
MTYSVGGDLCVGHFATAEVLSKVSTRGIIIYTWALISKSLSNLIFWSMLSKDEGVIN